MDYKLVKEYPGSPALGNIAIALQPNSEATAYACTTSSNIQLILPGWVVRNYPEFWQPEVEMSARGNSLPLGSLIWFNTILGRVINDQRYLSEENRVVPKEVSRVMEGIKDLDEIYYYFQGKLK
jgi:hypothetical protein